jgi:hypothetical protein
MDDKRIEDMLRESWTPMEPEGMRDRVLRCSRQELPCNPHHVSRGRLRSAVPYWKAGLVALGVLIILLSNVAESARQNRISAMTFGSGTADTSMCRESPFTRKLEMEKYYAQALAGERLLDIHEGELPL